jgi:hypothetical protein
LPTLFFFLTSFFSPLVSFSLFFPFLTYTCYNNALADQKNLHNDVPQWRLLCCWNSDWLLC